MRTFYEALKTAPFTFGIIAIVIAFSIVRLVRWIDRIRAQQDESDRQQVVKRLYKGIIDFGYENYYSILPSDRPMGKYSVLMDRVREKDFTHSGVLGKEDVRTPFQLALIMKQVAVKIAQWHFDRINRPGYFDGSTYKIQIFGSLINTVLNEVDASLSDLDYNGQSVTHERFEEVVRQAHAWVVAHIVHNLQESPERVTESELHDLPGHIEKAGGLSKVGISYEELVQLTTPVSYKALQPEIDNSISSIG